LEYLLDVPKPDTQEWFALRRSIKLELSEELATQNLFWGMTTRISETAADIVLTQPRIPRLNLGETLSATISILEENLTLSAKITKTITEGGFLAVSVIFDELTLEQERKLVSMLFCRAGQWKRRNSPGELQSLWLLIKILLQPRILFARQPQINAIQVSQS
jgi:cellulose synthase (UDP-forming)